MINSVDVRDENCLQIVLFMALLWFIYWLKLVSMDINNCIKKKIKRKKKRIPH